jgi:hypothetical protein
MARKAVLTSESDGEIAQRAARGEGGLLIEIPIQHLATAHGRRLDRFYERCGAMV